MNSTTNDSKVESSTKRGSKKVNHDDRKNTKPDSSLEQRIEKKILDIINKEKKNTSKINNEVMKLIDREVIIEYCSNQKVNAKSFLNKYLNIIKFLIKENRELRIGKEIDRNELIQKDKLIDKLQNELIEKENSINDLIQKYENTGKEESSNFDSFQRSNEGIITEHKNKKEDYINGINESTGIKNTKSKVMPFQKNSTFLTKNSFCSFTLENEKITKEDSCIQEIDSLLKNKKSNFESILDLSNVCEMKYRKTSEYSSKIEEECKQISSSLSQKEFKTNVNVKELMNHLSYNTPTISDGRYMEPFTSKHDNEEIYMVQSKKNRENELEQKSKGPKNVDNGNEQKELEMVDTENNIEQCKESKSYISKIETKSETDSDDKTNDDLENIMTTIIKLRKQN